MTDAQINQAIAEACGWKRGEPGATGEARWIPPDGKVLCYRGAMPDYVNDLNAMSDAVAHLPKEIKPFYIETLRYKILAMPVDSRSALWLTTVEATARQRAEAFLRTVGAWRDSA